MAYKLDIIKQGNSILSTPTKHVDVIEGDVKMAAEHMLYVMAAKSAAGVAANQLGYTYRMFVFQLPKERSTNGQGIDATVVINPHIEFFSEETCESFESCLSLPGMTGKVSRSKNIIYAFLDIRGEKQKQNAEDLHARIIQHEVDHLDGITYIERMKNLKDFGFKDEILR